MKKRIVALLMCTAMVTSMVVGCGSGSSDSSSDASSSDDSAATTEDSGEAKDISDCTFAIVPKSAGNPFNEAEAKGFQEAIEAAGAECIVSYPEQATADAQITVLQSLISQGVDSISVAANDENALQATLQQAMDAGIKVSCFDSKTNADSRQVFVNQADTELIGQTLMDAVYDITGGEGQWAILSATSQAANQNAWIEAMQNVMEGDEKYANLELVDIVYGDDEPQPSTEQTQALLQNYPDLKLICAPTTVGINAAAKVLQDQNSDVKITGLGMPSEMEAYVGEDNVCPYFYLWNPIDLGELAAYTAMALVSGDITGAAGDTFDAGDMENSPYTVVDASDGGTEIILGEPFEFNPDNIAEWADVF